MRMQDAPSQSCSVDEASGTVDSVVRRSIEQLFEAHELPATVLPSAEPQGGDASCFFAEIPFERDGCSGSLRLSVPAAVVAATRPGLSSREQYQDWTGELSNQLLGRVKHQLLSFAVRLEMGVPVSVPAPPNRGGGTEAASCYLARTNTGDVAVMLVGLPDDTQLGHEGGTGLSEGDCLLF